MSAAWPDPSFEADLRRLLRQARKASREADISDPATWALDGSRVTRVGVQTPFVIIEGETLRLLRSLQRRLAGSSRATSGFSPDEMQPLLLDACEASIAGTIKAAIAELLATISSPIEEWSIAEPVEMALTVPRLVVGRTTYSHRVHRSAFHDSLDQSKFVPPFACTRVKSRTPQTARVLARQRFAESLAVLDLAAPPANTGSHVTSWRRASGSGSRQYSTVGPIIGENLVLGTRLRAPYRQLAQATGREESKRSDWERRVLAATRWFSRSHRSPWPADRLAGAMVALECLFIADRRERSKGNLIATRLTERFQMNEKAATAQIQWLLNLYRARNDAVHEGRDFLDDLDVDRLVDLTRYVVVISSHHLDPSHSKEHRSCRTFDDAMRCSAPT